MPTKPTSPFVPTLAYLRNLPEAGRPITDYADREAAIIDRVTKALAHAAGDLAALRAQAKRELDGRWTPAEIAEAKAAL